MLTFAIGHAPFRKEVHTRLLRVLLWLQLACLPSLPAAATTADGAVGMCMLLLHAPVMPLVLQMVDGRCVQAV